MEIEGECFGDNQANIVLPQYLFLSCKLSQRLKKERKKERKTFTVYTDRPTAATYNTVWILSIQV